MLRGSVTIWAFAALFCAPMLAAQDAPRDKQFDWKTLETDHFKIHYYDDSVLEHVRVYAYWFEESYNDYSLSLNLKLRSKSDIFIFNSVNDLVQSPYLSAYRKGTHKCNLAASREFALAEPLYNRIFIPMQGSRRAGRWFARHELAHIFQYEAIYTYKLPSYLFVTWGSLIPAWFWEGFADYAAGIFESSKFLNVYDYIANNPDFDFEVLFDFENLLPHDYVLPYDIGAYFFRFLQNKYGTQAPYEVFRGFAETFPVPSSGVIERVTGKKFGAVKQEFVSYVRTLGAGIFTGKEHFSIIADMRLYYRFNPGFVSVSPDGRRIAYRTVYDGSHDIEIRDLTGGPAVKVFGLTSLLHTSGIHSGPRWNADSTKIVFAAGYYNKDYIWIYDTSSGHRTKIAPPDFDEVSDPSFISDNVIVFSGFKSGRSDIYTYSVKDSKLTRVTDDDYWDISPAVSPDGAMLAYVSERDAVQRLVVINISDRSVVKVTRNNNLIRNINWDRGSKYIAFSADYRHKYDVFAMDVETGGVYKLTDSAQSAAAPNLDIDAGRLVYVSFDNRGHLIKQSEAVLGKPIDDFDEKEREGEFTDSGNRQYAGGNVKRFVNEFGVNWLMAPFHYGYGMTLGAQVQLEDIKGENLVGITASYLGAGVSLTQLSYSYRHFSITPSVAGSVLSFPDGSIDSVALLGTYQIDPNVSASAGIVQRRYEFDKLEDKLEIGGDDDLTGVGGLFSLNLGAAREFRVFDAQKSVSLSYDMEVFREGRYSDRDLTVSTLAGSGSYAIAQDVIAHANFLFSVKTGTVFDIDKFDIDRVARIDLAIEGSTIAKWTAEARFPLYRDLDFMPFEMLSVGEYFVVDNFFAFVFNDLVYLSEINLKDTISSDYRYNTAGIGIRIDFLVFIPVLLTPRRFPVRLEVWSGYNDAEEETQSGFLLYIAV